MLGRLALLGLLATTALVAGCGDSSSQKNTPKPVNGAAQVNAKAETGKSRTYFAPATKLKISSGLAPAVVLLPDTGGKATATSEAQKLAKIGFGSLVVEGPATAPKDVKAFETAVHTV